MTSTLIRNADGIFTGLPGEAMRASGAIVKMQGGKLETVNSPVFISGVEKQTPRMAPALGEHTREVLHEVGYADPEIESMIKSGAVTATA